MLKTKRLSIVPTFRCTLNCKLCGNHIPDFRRQGNTPSDATLEEMKSDIEEYVKVCAENGIPFVLKKYYGDITEQHFGGWIDNTGLRDYGETNEEIAEKVMNCPQVRLENMHCFKGKLHRCSNSLFIGELGLYRTPNVSAGDFADLYDDTLSLDEKREAIGNFYKTPRASCRYCSWKDADIAERHPACEQLVKGIYF